MSWNTVKHFFLAGCWRNESILPGPGDILRLTDLLARDRLLCLPSAAPFPFSSSLARSLPLFFSLPLSACPPACSRSRMKPAPCSLSVCLSLGGFTPRWHLGSATAKPPSSSRSLPPCWVLFPLPAQLASMCLHAAALPAWHTLLHNTLHLPVRVAPPEHHNQSKNPLN